MYGPKTIPSSVDLLSCNFTVSKHLDAPPILRRLYGPTFDQARSRQGPGEGGILVLGHHNSGTSMLARLLMLMGAFQGNLDGISTSPRNRLKYWEKLSVSHFHEIALGWVTDKRFKPFQAQGVRMGNLTPEQRQKINCFTKRTVADLNRVRPFMLKDPRMLLFTKFWVDQIAKPVCIITFRDPLSNAISLAENYKKSAGAAEGQHMTVRRWLVAWEEGLLSALLGCQGHPTVLVQHDDVLADLTRFMYKLYAQLGQAGVQGLQMPTARALHSEFLQYLKAERVAEDLPMPHRDGLSRSQAALYIALQMVASSPNNGLASEPRRADAVLQIFQDTVNYWWED